MRIKDLRGYVQLLKEGGFVKKISELLSTKYEVSSVLKKYDGERAVHFVNVKNYQTHIFGNLCCRRNFIAKGLGVSQKQLIERIVHATQTPLKPRISNSGPSQEVEVDQVDLLHELPILTHYEYDGGPYITSGIVIAKDPNTNRINASYHRMMVIGKNMLVARLVEGRDLHRFYLMAKSNGKPLEAAVVIGGPLEFLVAASTSPGELSEIEVAGGLIGTPLELVRCKAINVEVPRYAEIVLEGRFLLKDAKEGPFVDVTGTYDVERKQPIFEVTTITRREDAFYQALLPSCQEHSLLMGMPKEAKILSVVSLISKVHDVALTPAGSNWLDAAISIQKIHTYEPFLVGMAAFTAHSSLKRVTIVDDDIDVHDFLAVEKAVIERAHPLDDYLTVRNVKGSSLDKSGIRTNGTTLPPAKLLIDATIKGERRFFERAKIPSRKEHDDL